MFQIIYRRIYLFYVVMNSFDVPFLNETLLLTCTFPPDWIVYRILYIFGLIFICYCLWICPKSSLQYALRHSTILHNAEVVEHCVSAAGKTSVMQLCCHFRLTNRQWQTIRKGKRVEWCRWQTAVTFGVLWPPECKAHTVFTAGQQQHEHVGPPPWRKAYRTHRAVLSTSIISQLTFSQLDMCLQNLIFKYPESVRLFLLETANWPCLICHFQSIVLKTFTSSKERQSSWSW